MSNNIKVVLVGESNTGKTSIINRFCSDIFKEDTRVTLGSARFSKTLELSSFRKVILNIWDTAGQEAYRSINKIFYKDAKIVIFVYDITNIKTFEEIGSYWLDEVKNTVDDDTGNKSDLYANEAISEEIASNFAREKDLMFKLVSAKKNIAIYNLFKDITTLYLDGNINQEETNHNINLNEKGKNTKKVKKSFC